MKKMITLLLSCALVLGLFACAKAPTWQEQYDLGVKYLTEGKYEEAIIAFTAAIEIDPKQALAYVGRGDAYVQSGETEENLTAAQADYEQAIELDETIAEAYLGLADVYIRQGDYEKAYEVLTIGFEKTGGDQRIGEKIAEIESGTYTDSSNHVRRSNDYDVDGTLSGYTLYEYDFLGRRNFWKNYHRIDGEESNGTDDFTLSNYCEVDFDEENRPVQYRFYGADGMASSYDMFVYDERGLKTEQYRYSSDDSLEFYFLFYYDDGGRETKYEAYLADGEMTNYWISEYDEAGNLTKETNYSPDGTVTGYKVYS